MIHDNTEYHITIQNTTLQYKRQSDITNYNMGIQLPKIQNMNGYSKTISLFVY